MKDLNLIYYSPTGTTQKIVRKIGEELNLKQNEEYRITSNQVDFKPKFNDDCLTIIGMPVYGGRLPLNAVQKLKGLNANNTLAVIVVVYGNRAYEDSLLELKMIVSNCGFKVIAAAAFIGEHSFSTIDKPIAKGRPDHLDFIKCIDFSQIIHDKMNKLNNENLFDIEIPGNYPYKERSKKQEIISPDINYDKCSVCGNCIDACSSDAISMINNQVEINGELCTWCCACVKNCQNGALVFDNPTINEFRERLNLMCSDRKEPEFFV